MPYVKTLRPCVVVTMSGHRIPVEPGNTQYVPPEALEDAFKVGCGECDKDGKLKLDLEPVKQLPVGDMIKLSEVDRTDANKRAEAILQAIAKLYQDNDPKSFTTSNLPRAKAIETLVGFPTSAAEVSAAVEKFHAAN